MLYKQQHRDRTHLYWSSTDKIHDRISIGKLDEIEQIIAVFFGNQSRNKKAILEILKVFERFNLIEFLEQSKKTILSEITDVKL